MQTLESMLYNRFKTLDYLQGGTERQQAAYACLKQLKIWEVLAAQVPLLVGTIPIEIDGPDSDLDVIGWATDLEDQARRLTQHYGHHADYRAVQTVVRSIPCLVVNFEAHGFPVEVFLQDKPTHQQDAYRHMLIEYRLLQERGITFRQKILQLKQLGIKTEPAFAQLLGLQGDPYEALLLLE